MDPVKNPAELVAVALGLCLAFSILGNVLQACLNERSKKFRYKVNAVPYGLCEDYRKENPTHPEFEAFCRAALANDDYASHHARLRRDARRLAVKYPGMALFVEVLALPEA